MQRLALLESVLPPNRVFTIVGKRTSQQELAIWQPAWPTKEIHRQYMWWWWRDTVPRARCGEGRVKRRGNGDGGHLPLMLITSRMLAYPSLQEEWRS